MKNSLTLLTFGFLIILLIFACGSKHGSNIDGVYKGSSQADYIDEPYWGNITITIKNGYIKQVEFNVVDSAKKEIFDQNYEHNFIGHKVYIEQCRSDWKGIQTYPEKLIQAQDIDKVDAITGATWSYNIMKAATKEALKNVKK